eukprot:3939572-Rhodomonas_salina.1
MPAQAANSETLLSSLLMSDTDVARSARSSAKQVALCRTPHPWTNPTPAVPRCLRHRLRKKTNKEGLRESP